MQKGKEPFFISGWDIDNENVVFPETLIKSALSFPYAESMEYNFSEDLHHLKLMISKYILEYEKIDLIEDEICITHNATSSIYLTLYSLILGGCKNFMIFTPVYFSILHTINDFNCNLFYFHLKNQDQFYIDLDLLFSQIVLNNIDVLVITDPIYSTSILIPDDVFSEIINRCKKANIWIVVDSTLGGINWNEEIIRNFSKKKMDILKNIEKKVIISSFPKNLFLNGLKYSLAVGNKDIMIKIEDLSCKVSGSFCTPQLNLIKIIYDDSNYSFIQHIATKNLEKIKNNYSILEASLLGTDWEVCSSNSGYFTMIYNVNYKIYEIDSQLFVKEILENHDIRILPSEYFNFQYQNLYGIRINLLKDIKSFLPILIDSIDKNFQRFKYLR